MHLVAAFLAIGGTALSANPARLQRRLQSNATSALDVAFSTVDIASAISIDKKFEGATSAS
eukprot:5913789-Prymnesium_polylepis.1